MSILWLFHSERVDFTWYPAGYISSFICCKLGFAYGKGLNLWSIREASAVGRECGWGSAERNGKCGKEREVVWEVAADSGGEDKIKAPTGQGIQWERW